MPFPFFGVSARIYPQYRDLVADTPLTAVPGQSYDMAPVADWDVPVPPGDGLWGPATEPAEDVPEAPAVEREPEPAVPDLPPVPLITAPAETEES